MWYDATRTSWYQCEAGRSCYGSYGAGALGVGEDAVRDLPHVTLNVECVLRRWKLY
jgi:hypothetical protein